MPRLSISNILALLVLVGKMDVVPALMFGALALALLVRPE